MVGREKTHEFNIHDRKQKKHYSRTHTDPFTAGDKRGYKTCKQQHKNFFTRLQKNNQSGSNET